MQRSIRERAIELDAVPIHTNPLAEGPNPEIYQMKLEADSYMAIAASMFADKVVKDPEDQDSFVYRFSKEVLDNNDVDNSPPDITKTLRSFSRFFGFEFTQKHDAEILRETRVGRAASAACVRYYDAAKDAVADGSGTLESNVALRLYSTPEYMLAAGVNTLNIVTNAVILATYREHMNPKERLKVLRNSESSVRQVASLALHQFSFGHQTPGMMEIKDGRVIIEPDLRATRQISPTDETELIRPHHGCPAMPVMPKGNDLKRGSALGKMYNMAIDLVERTDVHALDEEPSSHYTVIGQRLYETAIKNYGANGLEEDDLVF